MFRPMLITLALLALSTTAFAQSVTKSVVLHPGDNVVNLSMATPPAPRVSAPRATCAADRAANPTSERTVAVCTQAKVNRPPN